MTTDSGESFSITRSNKFTDPPPITEYLRAQRLLWIGHVQRMNESDRVSKKCLLGQPDGTRLRGRPKARYMELIEKDLNKYKITG